MISNKQGVIYLQRDRFQIYSPFIPSIFEFRFVPEIIRDLDVINKELFENIIKLFISNTKIPPSTLLIVIADNAAFIQDFQRSNQLQQSPTVQPTQSVSKNEGDIWEELQDQIKKFLEHIPFDTVSSRTFPLNNGLRVLAVNQDLYDCVKSAFQAQGFAVNAVLPGLSFGDGMGTKSSLDIPTANLFLQKFNSLKQYNFLIQEPVQTEMKEKADELEPPATKGNRRVIALISIFVLLIGILILVYFINIPKKPSINKSNAAQIPVESALSPTISVVQEVKSSSNLLNLDEAKNLTVQIINASSSARPALLLKERLRKYNFKNIDIQTQSFTGSSQNIIIFSANPSLSIKNSLIEEVKKFSGEVKVQDKKEATFDIRIILGQ